MAQVIQTDETLRRLLRTARRRAGLTQDEAAKLAGVTQGWWKKVENASNLNVTEELMASMLAIVGIMPKTLKDRGYPDLACLVDEWLSLDDNDSTLSLEDYLRNAPAPPALRNALVLYARTWEHMDDGARSEPFADQFMPARIQRRRPLPSA